MTKELKGTWLRVSSGVVRKKVRNELNCSGVLPNKESHERQVAALISILSSRKQSTNQLQEDIKICTAGTLHCLPTHKYDCSFVKILLLIFVFRAWTLPRKTGTRGENGTPKSVAATFSFVMSPIAIRNGTFLQIWFKGSISICQLVDTIVLAISFFLTGIFLSKSSITLHVFSDLKHDGITERGVPRCSKTHFPSI